MKINQLVEPVKSEVEKPFEAKLKRTKQLIKLYCSLCPGKGVVSCSFGKDSLIVLSLARDFNPRIPVVFNNTGVQYPETYGFKSHLVDEWNLNLIETKPCDGWNFWKIANKYGLPDGSKYDPIRDVRGDHCCYYLKDKPMRQVIKQHGFAYNLTGITAVESRVRMFRICESGNHFYSRKDGVLRIHPIAYWTTEEVWNFIDQESIPVNPAYKKYGLERMGCVPCTSHKHWREQLAKVNRKLYSHIQERYFGQKTL